MGPSGTELLADEDPGLTLLSDTVYSSADVPRSLRVLSVIHRLIADPQKLRK